MLVTKSFSKLEAAIGTEGNLGPEAWAILVISLTSLWIMALKRQMEIWTWTRYMMILRKYCSLFRYNNIFWLCLKESLYRDTYWHIWRWNYVWSLFQNNKRRGSYWEWRRKKIGHESLTIEVGWWAHGDYMTLSIFYVWIFS